MASYVYGLSPSYPRKQVLMDLGLWRQLVTDAVYWRRYTDDMLVDLYQRTVSYWCHGVDHYAQGPATVNLTQLFEQYRILAMLKGTYHEVR